MSSILLPCPCYRSVRNLCGQLPDGCTESLDAARHASLESMKSGQRFFQYFKSSSGVQVRKNILIFYVADPSGRSAGKLCWTEKSRQSISPNRQLPLDKITDIYLGAQTAVLKRATESAHHSNNSADNSSSPSFPPPNESLLFSLLSDTTMLDLECCGEMAQLCYWLWGLGVIMQTFDRTVNERELVGAGGVGGELDVLNTSCLRNLNTSLDTSIEVTDSEMDSLKRDLIHATDGDHAPKAASRPMRRHTRKFSVTMTGALNDSAHLQLEDLAPAQVKQLVQQCKLPPNLVAPVKSSWTQMRSTVVSELESMNKFITANMTQLLTETHTHAVAFDALTDSLALEQRKRRRLQNKLIELQGNIRVFARVRPLSASEQSEGSCIEFPCENTLALTHGGAEAKAYEFDKVYPPVTTQEEVFKDVAPFVQSAVDGYNICVFAYGQVGRRG